ncbi:exopolysaccharide biosynthesis protein [Mesorhizobium sp. 113-1-2]|uniref:GumC family protein n=1 Tax=Mesorhizobium sp. 113-1-2 TaxID=2744515 RepID=UPI000819971B|nr:exopolysaccharide transport family protein [Mesorhizobium sp. 113-1-2]BAV47560.1 exopolysaccharide biosynthesis protein [Mesorhizobium loti]BCG71257.1 exopolysaccharide biosynthesis protein [Mesorhizobium sp. 113-1-2]
MEGSIASRARLPRAKQMTVATLDTNSRMSRPSREPVQSPSPLHQLVVTLATRKWLLLAVALLGGILAGLAGFTRPVLFEATTQVIIDAPSGGTSGATASAQDSLESSIDDHLTMLSSQGHLRRVLAALRQPRAADLAAKSGISAVPPAAGSFLSDLLSRVWTQGKPAAGSPEADAAALKTLRNGMRVGQELRSRVITIGFTDASPARAALVANTFAQVYIEDLVEKRRASDQFELESLVASLPQVQKDLVEATDRLETYRLTHGAVDQSAANNAAGETAELGRQIFLSKANLSASEARLHHIEDLRKAGAPVSAIAEAIGSPVLTDLVARQQGAAADGDLGNAITREMEQGIARIAAEANVYRAQVAALEERKGMLDAAVADTASQLSGLRALEPQVAIVTQHYNELLGRQQDLIRRIAAPSPGVAILSTAWPPSNSKTLSPFFLIPPGMIVFGLMGAVLVLVRNMFNQTLRSEAEAEAELGIPCIGLLPKVPGLHARQLRHLVLGQQNSPFSRAATSLLVTAAPTQGRGQPPHIILVTSSIQDDGKTELAWSLALAATRLGGRVLFLDLDRKDARLTNEFRGEFGTIKAHNSFGDYVSERCTLKDAITRMPEIGIDLMAAPAPSDDLLTLLSTVDKSQFTDELLSVYDVVIMNGPLGLGGPETRLLKRWADAVLFAVRWSRTRRSIARGVLESLRAGGPVTAPVGSVLTQVNLKRHAGYQLGDSADLLLARV